MTWFKVDDTLAFHPKVLAAGNAAIGLWVRAGSWSAQQLKDGFVPDSVVATLDGKAAAKKLEEVGLWHRVEGGWQFHDWTSRQPTREQVEADRKAAKERMRRHRRKPETDDGSPDVRANDERTSGAVRFPRPDPTRPISESSPQQQINRTARLTPEHRTATLRDAAERIADARGLRNKGNNPTAYFASAVKGIVTEIHDQAHDYLTDHPDATGIDLAEHLLRPAPRPSAFPDDFFGPATADPDWELA